MSDFGYWVVTYSISPGVDLSMMICKTGITRDEAIKQGEITLGATQTGKVT